MASEEEEKKMKLRKKIEYQVACEEKAFKIVERLIENPVPEQMLIDGLQFITPNHYNDIVEERVVSQLCGYPVCGNQLSNVLKQKYVISTKTNKVYDIEARKNFCCGKCYKASLYLQKQISSSPVWSRQKQPPVKFELLPLDGKSSCVGDEVKLSLREDAKDELVKLEKLDTYQEALKKKQNQMKESSQSASEVNKHSKGSRSDSGDLSEKGIAVDTIEQKKVTGTLTDNTNEEKPDLFGTQNEMHEMNSDNDECVYTLDRALEEMKIDNSETDSEVCDVEAKGSGSRKIDCGSSGDQTSKGNSDLGKQARKPEVKQKSVEVQNIRGNAMGIQNINIENETLPDRNLGLIDKSLKNDSKFSNKDKILHDKGESKTDYLMKLLDKRKSLLAKMADIQPLVETDQKSLKQGSLADSLKNNQSSVREHETCTNVSERTENALKDKIVVIESDDFKVTSDKEGRGCVIKEKTGSSLPRDKAVTDSTIANVFINNSSTVTVQRDSDVEIHSRVGTKENTPVVSGQTFIDGDSSYSSESDRKGRNVSVLQLICKTIHAWMTVESLEYLSTKEPKERAKDKSEFERQYKALEARVDKQERELGDFLGEEALAEEDTSERPSAPLPHFEVLRKEVEDITIRVREYLKGSLTYKVEERDTSSKKEGGPLIVLPSVDRYDQMLIRQRIVLDRISKVLPDLLSSLHMLVQDVFTDIRELVATFNLTKDNILFKPAEWILVTIVILKLISARNANMKRQFSSPEARKYFTVVLRGAHSSLEELASCITHLKKSASRS